MSDELADFFASRFDKQYVIDCVLLGRKINIASAYGVLDADPGYEPIEYLEGNGVEHPQGIITPIHR